MIKYLLYKAYGYFYIINKLIKYPMVKIETLYRKIVKKGVKW